MPNAMEMMVDPAARAEGLSKAKTLPEGHLTNLVKYQIQESEDATKELRHTWQEYFRLWMNEVDFSDKEDWQSKIWVSKIFSAVEQGTALIQRSLVDSPDAFSIEGFDIPDKTLANNLWKPLLRLFLDNARLIYKFSDTCKMGLITGVAGYLKMRPVSVNVPRLMSAQMGPTDQVTPMFQYSPRTFLAIDVVRPWNIYRDPESLPRENYSGSYLYHRERKDRSSIQNMVKFGWDPLKIQQLLASKEHGDISKSFTQQMEASLKQYGNFARHRYRFDYTIDEGWLDILDENGDVVVPNALMVHSNGKILYGPVDNPIWATDLNTGRRKWPFIAGTPIVHPFRFEGRGIVEQDAVLAALYSNVFMLWADGLNWKVNKPTELYQDALVDWEDLSHYPGKLWVKHTPDQALMPAEIGEMNTNEIMGALDYIDRTRQNVNFITDFAVGLPGSRSEITKGEVQIKTSQSLAIFEAMGKNLEQMGRDAVELAYDLVLQFFDQYSDPQIGRILGPEAQFFLSQMSVEERMEALQGNYDFTFTGVTAALQKSDLLNRVIQFATLAASPGYAGFTNPSEVLGVISNLLGIDDRVTVSQEQMIPVSQMNQMVGQLISEMPGGPPNGPGGPVGPGGAPPAIPTQGQGAPIGPPA